MPLAYVGYLMIGGRNGLILSVHGFKFKSSGYGGEVIPGRTLNPLQSFHQLVVHCLAIVSCQLAEWFADVFSSTFKHGLVRKHPGFAACFGGVTELNIIGGATLPRKHEIARIVHIIRNKLV